MMQWLTHHHHGLYSSNVWVWKLDHKEGWALNNWCFWTVVLEKTLESPLDIEENKQVNPKESQPWIFIGRTDAEVETWILWLPMERADSSEKTLMLGNIQGKRRRELMRMRWLNSVTDSIDMNLNKCQEIVKDREPWCAAFHGVAKSQTWLRNWTTTTVSRIK